MKHACPSCFTIFVYQFKKRNCICAVWAAKSKLRSFRQPVMKIQKLKVVKVKNELVWSDETKKAEFTTTLCWGGRAAIPRDFCGDHRYSNARGTMSQTDSVSRHLFGGAKVRQLPSLVSVKIVGLAILLQLDFAGSARKSIHAQHKIPVLFNSNVLLNKYSLCK